MIADILQNNQDSAISFTRPRRFGKSLNLSMLRYFFDMTEDSASLFEGLYIEKSAYIETHMNQYPVLNLNFKDIATRNIEVAESSIIRSVSSEVRRLDKKYQIEELKQISLESVTGVFEPQSLKEITQVLYEHTGKRVIVLVDEYDSVINRSYGTPYWQDIVAVVKTMFGALLKSNEYLEMAVLTGVSRIGKELGFSDMNNLAVYGLTTDSFYQYFGFSEAEVKELIRLNQISMSEEFYQMYNGYQYGNSPFMFNTSSMLKYLKNYYETGDKTLAPYWINSSTNMILKDNIAKQSSGFKEMLLSLLEGGTIEKSIFESIDYDYLDKPEYMLSLLIDTGYLCPVKKVGGYVFEIKIPNEEVRYGYRDMINSIINTDSEKLNDLCEALIMGKIDKFTDLLNRILLEVASYHDFSDRENSYHNLMLGALLYLLGRFRVYSNREAGHGRYDIILIPVENCKDKYKPIIIEFKAAKEKASENICSEEELMA